MDHGFDTGHQATRPTDAVPRATTDGDLAAFLGHFTRDEALSVMRARVDAAIEQAIAPLSWPARLVLRPTLRFVAELPEWIQFELEGEMLAATFSSGVSLRAELGGAARVHQLPLAIRGNARHFWNAGRLCTEIVSDVGTVSNMFERLSEGALLGHAQLASQFVPLPIRYSMRLRRTQQG
jgi:hypothetical protein